MTLASPELPVPSDSRSALRGHTFTAMGTAVTVTVADTPETRRAVQQVTELFARVDRSCTRFDPSSDLMRANRQPSKRHQVSIECAEIIAAAHRAYRATNGIFDPRVLDALVSAGYDRTFADIVSQSSAGGASLPLRAASDTWEPEIDLTSQQVRLGDAPIDLGGIGKGWTVDAASRLLADVTPDFLVNAGGDLAVRGNGAAGDGWTVAVEDPSDPTLSLAILGLRDAACATSSTGRRTWLTPFGRMHHIIDPRTRLPARSGIASVTVIADTATHAETWSKTLLIEGAGNIADRCSTERLAAYWVLDDGTTSFSKVLGEHVMWERTPHG